MVRFGKLHQAAVSLVPQDLHRDHVPVHPHHVEDVGHIGQLLRDVGNEKDNTATRSTTASPPTTHVSKVVSISSPSTSTTSHLAKALTPKSTALVSKAPSATTKASIIATYTYMDERDPSENGTYFGGICECQ